MDSGQAAPRTDGTAAPDEPAFRGERLGLPPSGSGSMAGIWRRVLALAIDWLVCLIVARVLVEDPQSALASFATLGVFFVEVTILTWLTGASFGQRFAGLRVVGRSRRLGLVGSALRTALICVVIPPLVWDNDGRGLHDRAVDSVVVRA